MEKKIYTIVCEYCGKEFEALQFYARYCCDSHRQMAYAKRKQEGERSAEKVSKTHN